MRNAAREDDSLKLSRIIIPDHGWPDCYGLTSLRLVDFFVYQKNTQSNCPPYTRKYTAFVIFAMGSENTKCRNSVSVFQPEVTQSFMEFFLSFLLFCLNFYATRKSNPRLFSTVILTDKDHNSSEKIVLLRNCHTSSCSLFNNF